MSALRPDIVTARALAPLPKLLGYIAPFLERGAKALLLKGQDVEEELTEASKYWRIDAELARSETDASGRILIVKGLQRLTWSRASVQHYVALQHILIAAAIRPRHPTIEDIFMSGHEPTSGKTDSGVVEFPQREPIRVEAGKPPRVLAIANQKGGVGKTTTAINLGTALAAIGEQVLILDLDPQGNASTGLGIDRRSREFSTYDVLTGAANLRARDPRNGGARLHIAASTMDLSGLELEIGQMRDRAFRLRSCAGGPQLRRC